MKPSTLEIPRRGLMFVLSSPSGAGKTSIARRILETDMHLNLSVSVTTRKRRPGEVHGRDYYFIDEAHFMELKRGNQLLEYAEVFGNWYGTPRQPVEDALGAGQDVLFDIDWQGTQSLSAHVRNDMVTLFILPPSFQVLEQRLRSRAQDSEEVVALRMAQASAEMSHWAEYDYAIVNQELERSVTIARSILTAERSKRHRQLGLASFVSQLREGK